MAATLSEQLDEVQTAITAILERGQAYTINGRMLTRANLRELQTRENDLRRRIQQETRGGIRVRYGVPPA